VIPKLEASARKRTYLEGNDRSVAKKEQLPTRQWRERE
jgi:hypothetical protein